MTSTYHTCLTCVWFCWVTTATCTWLYLGRHDQEPPLTNCRHAKIWQTVSSECLITLSDFPLPSPHPPTHPSSVTIHHCVLQYWYKPPQTEVVTHYAHFNHTPISSHLPCAFGWQKQLPGVNEQLIAKAAGIRGVWPTCLVNQCDHSVCRPAMADSWIRGFTAQWIHSSAAPDLLKMISPLFAGNSPRILTPLK